MVEVVEAVEGEVKVVEEGELQIQTEGVTGVAHL
jgi:hypothetical protein